MIALKRWPAQGQVSETLKTPVRLTLHPIYGNQIRLWLWRGMRRISMLLLLPGLAISDTASNVYEKAIEISKCYGNQRAFANYMDAAMPMTPTAEQAYQVAAKTKASSLALFNSAGLSDQEAEDAVERYSHPTRTELASRIDATEHDPKAFVQAIEPLCQCNAKLNKQRRIIDAILGQGYR